MSVGYRLLYRFGITPWDQDTPPQLRAVAERPSGAPGRALDLGCGTGRDAVFLAEHGWTVTGVDAVPRALESARERSEAAGVKVAWVDGDVTRLPEYQVDGKYDLVVDSGCFHGLNEREREQCASGIDAVTAPGATLMMMGFAPGKRGPAPRGISEEEVRRHFGGRGWTLISATEDTDLKLPGPLRKARPTWYRLRKA